MTTEPTIIDEDRAAAEEYLPLVPKKASDGLGYSWGLDGSLYGGRGNAEHARSQDVRILAAIIARHREQREKVLVEALRFYAHRQNYSRNPAGGLEIDVDGGATARQALKGYEQ